MQYYGCVLRVFTHVHDVLNGGTFYWWWLLQKLLMHAVLNWCSTQHYVACAVVS